MQCQIFKNWKVNQYPLIRITPLPRVWCPNHMWYTEKQKIAQKHNTERTRWFDVLVLFSFREAMICWSYFPIILVEYDMALLPLKWRGLHHIHMIVEQMLIGSILISTDMLDDRSLNLFVWLTSNAGVCYEISLVLVNMVIPDAGNVIGRVTWTCWWTIYMKYNFICKLKCSVTLRIACRATNVSSESEELGVSRGCVIHGMIKWPWVPAQGAF